jgi:phospholipid-binding lipoprotein MlaA
MKRQKRGSPDIRLPVIFVLSLLLSAVWPLTTDAAEDSDKYGDVTKEELETGGQPAGDAYGEVTPETAEAADDEIRIADPLERWNRAMFQVNDKLYFWVLKPVTRGYAWLVPEDFRALFSNFYNNLSAPIRLVNNLFQFKFRYASQELTRIAINTTMGVGGLRDIAGDCFGIRGHEEDLGQTLGFYGAGHGFYLVWPVVGPSSVRDSIGFAGDQVFSPTWYLQQPFTATVGTFVHKRVNILSFRLGDYEAFKKAALDPYIAMRSAYVQHRRAEVAR